MFQELKRKYLIKNLTGAIFAFIMGGIVLFTQLDNIQMILEPAEDLNTLYADEIRDSMKVKVEVGAILDYYAYTEENGRVIEKEYIIPVGEEEYMGVVLGKSYLDQADRNLDATWAYMDGDDSALDRIEPIVVTGRVVSMSGESKQFYNEFVDSLGWEPEEEELFIPYMVMTGKAAGGLTGDFIFFGIVAALIIAFGIFLLVKGISGGALKNIRKYCESTGNKEMTMQRLEQFYALVQPVEGIRVSPEFIMAQTGGAVLVNDASKVLWVYQHVTSHYTNGIPTGKSYTIMVWMTDGTKMEIAMKSKKKSEEALDYIGRTLPYIFFGYDEQLQAGYNQNRQAMIQAMTDRKAQLMGQMPEEPMMTGGQMMSDNPNQGI